MIGGKKLRRSFAAATTAGLLLSIGTAQTFAADFGGSCCADLEERIAELEATTARKGNRKVSLTISGHVNQGVLYWDDGFEDNVGGYTNDNSRTRLRFLGKAKINADWEAGYRLELGFRDANSKRFTQDNPTAESGIDVRDSHWYVKNSSLGSVSVGLQSTATDSITEINQTQTADFSKYADVEDTGLGLRLRNASGALSNRYEYRRLIGVHGDQPGDGEKKFNGVRYTTPELAGFEASAFWGADDFWDVSLRYKGEFGGFKLAAGIGYGEITDGNQTSTACAAIAAADIPVLAGAPDTDCSQFGGSVSVLHVNTGLFVNFGAGIKKDDLIDRTVLFSGVAPDDEQTFWSVQAGIERKWTSFGNTTIYGEYYDYNGGSNTRTIDRDFTGIAAADSESRAAVLSTGLRSYGFGVAQGFDAAALTLYLSYRHVEGSLTAASTDLVGGNLVATTNDVRSVPLEDLDLVFAGGIIKF